MRRCVAHRSFTDESLEARSSRTAPADHLRPDRCCRQIFHDDEIIIAEGYFARIELARLVNLRESLEKYLEFLGDLDATRDMLVTALSPKPLSERNNKQLDLRIMGVNILPGNVGDIGLKPKLLAIKDDAGLLPLPLVAVFFGTEEDSEFKRHVKAGQGGALGPGDIVDAVAALGDDLADLIEAILGGVVGFQGAARGKARARDGEDNGVEKSLVFLIERAINEDITV
jgi:hypothetical protein